MNYKAWKSGLMAAAVLTAGAASAGTKYPSPVYIDTVGRYAQGSLSSARNSTDFNQWVTCNVQTGSYGTSSTNAGAISYASCWARDAGGVMRSCATTNANMIAVLANLQGDSTVGFQWDESGLCNYIWVGQSSASEPKGG